MTLDMDLGVMYGMECSCQRLCEQIEFHRLYLLIEASRKGTKWTHEVASEMMLDALIQENNVPIPKEDQEFIKALIAGDPLRT